LLICLFVYLFSRKSLYAQYLRSPNANLKLIQTNMIPEHLPAPDLFAVPVALFGYNFN